MDKTQLKKYLLAKESPFSWKIPEIADISHNKFIEVLSDKCQNIDEENDFKWARFTITLLLSYELCNKKDYVQALDRIKWCKDHLVVLHERRCKEPLFCDLFPILRFIASVTEALILLESDQLDKARKIADEWQFMSSVCTEQNTSAILGTKAAVYIRYGSAGHRLALKAATEAKNLDPEQPEWWYIVGNALGRIRRTENGDITNEEIMAIEKAFELRKNASYTVHLAQIYSEHSSNLFFGQDRRAESTKYAKSAVSMYRKALEMRPNCLTLKARVAHGMLRIKDRAASDIPFAKQLLDDIVKVTPSSAMAYHDLGYYYEKYGRDSQKAIMFLDKSNKLGNIKALIFLLTTKWKHDMKHEMIKDIEEGLTRFKSEEGQAQLLACLGACHALINDDWVASLKYLKMSLVVDPSAKYLEKFQGFNDQRVNLLKLMFNHLIVRAKGENKDEITSFLDFVSSLKPGLINPKEPEKCNFMEWKRALLKVVRKTDPYSSLRTGPRRGTQPRGTQPRGTQR